jgi:hypothetical protein
MIAMTIFMRVPSAVREIEPSRDGHLEGETGANPELSLAARAAEAANAVGEEAPGAEDAGAPAVA